MRTNISKKRSFIVSFFLISVGYIIGVMVLDEQLNIDIFDAIKGWDVVSILLLFVLSISIRYVRWHLLMKNHGISHDFVQGFFFYVGGFAYTVTPGKLGELSRAIHYRSVGVSSDVVISNFITERFFDLIIVSIMASGVFFMFPGFHLIALLILAIVGIISLLVTNIRMSKVLCQKLIKIRCCGVSRFSCLAYKVLVNINQKMSLKISFICLILGAVAWTCTSFILVYSCNIFNINIPFIQLFSIYPIAMLSGAVSFIPGGVGATEVVIVFLLSKFDVRIEIASTIALLVRFSTLWLAMIVGIFCTFISSVYIIQKGDSDIKN